MARDTKVELAPPEPLPLTLACRVYHPFMPAWEGEAVDEADAVAQMRAAFGITATVYPFRVEWE